MTRHALFGSLALFVAGTAPLAAAVVQIGITDFTYSPNDVTIHVGDTIHWVNQMGSHTVTADDGTFRSGNIRPPPWTFDRTFNSVGEFRYYCENHSGPGLDINTNMNGRIVVVAAEPPPFAINQGIAGAWYNPTTGG